MIHDLYRRFGLRDVEQDEAGELCKQLKRLGLDQRITWLKP
jgi:hypothetical protein